MKEVGGISFVRSQAQAIAKCTTRDKFYLVKWGTFLFHAFSDRISMESWFQTEYKKSIENDTPFCPLEVIYEGQRCGFFADIEGYAPIDIDPRILENVYNDIIEAVKEGYKQQGLDGSALMWSENHRTDHTKQKHKISFHAVGTDVDFIGTHKDSDLGRLAKKVNRYAQAKIVEKYPQIEFSNCGRTRTNTNILDLSVYSKNRAMRSIGSSKETSTDSRFTPCKGFEDMELSSWWIVRSDESRAVHREPWTPEDEEKMVNTKQRIGKQLSGAQVYTAMRSAPVAPKEALPHHNRTAERIAQYFRRQQNDSSITVKFTGVYQQEGFDEVDTYRLDGTNRDCGSCGRIHNSNGAGIMSLGGGKYVYKCFGGGAATRFIMRDEEPISKASGASAHVQHYQNIQKGRIPSILDMSERIIRICGGMGSGKTYRVHEYMTNNPEKSALYVTSRISMASDIYAHFKHLGFRAYNEEEVHQEINSFDRMICEYESLHRLRRTYDVVIIDETRAVMNSATVYTTNGANLIPNYDTLIHLSMECEKLIMMCADMNLDPAVDEFVKNVVSKDVGKHKEFKSTCLALLKGSDSKEDRNATRMLIKRHAEQLATKISTRYIQIQEPYMKRKFIQTPYSRAIEGVMTDVKQGKKIVISCGSANHMQTLQKNIEEFVPGTKIRAYHAACGEKNELTRIEEVWGDFDVIMYTSIVTVAIDYTGEVHRVYMFPNSSTSPPRDALQSAGRARNISTNEIIVASPVSKKGEVGEAHMPLADTKLDQYMKDELVKIEQSRDTRDEMLMTMKNTFSRRYKGGQVVPHDREWAFLPSHLTKIWACNRAEELLKRKSWYPHLLWILQKKGYELALHDDYKIQDEELIKERENIITKYEGVDPDEIATIKREFLEEIDVMEIEEEEILEMKKQERTGGASVEMKLTLMKYEVQKHFKEKLSADEVLAFIGKKRSILNVIRFLNIPFAEQEKKHLEIAEERDEVDFQSTDILVLGEILKILKHLGYSGFEDTNTCLDLLHIDSDEVVRTHMAKIASLVGRGKGDGHMKELNRLLKLTMGIKMSRVQKRQRGSKKRITFHKLEKDELIWQTAMKENDFYGGSWILGNVNCFVGIGENEEKDEHVLKKPRTK